MSKKERSHRQTLEQQRASQSWTDVTHVNKSAQSKYGTIARRLPALIQINGLGATMAFLCAKAKGDGTSGEGLLYAHISNWVVDRIKSSEAEDLMDLIRTEPTNIYRRATVEAIEYGNWLKRYVEALDWGSEQDDD